MVKISNTHLTPNFLETLDPLGNKHEVLMNPQDLIAAQALTLCATDQIMEELIFRMKTSLTAKRTILSDFKTNMLLTELAYRAQKIALTLVEAQSILAVSEYLFTDGNLFTSSHKDLDGYSLTGSNND